MANKTHDLSIKLLGTLGRRFGSSHHIKATRINQSISYLRSQFTDFESTIIELHQRGIKFSVVIQTPTQNFLVDDPNFLNLELTQDATTIIIAPVPAAAGDDTGKFLIGLGLVGIALFLPFTVGIFGATYGSATLGLIGAGLITQSIISWLSPKPPELKQSVISPSISNNTQGDSIPIIYGRRFVTPKVISGGSTITDTSSYQRREKPGFLGIGSWGEGYKAASSLATLTVVDAICEGKIKGLTNGERSIWINGVPLRNIDNSYAYQGVSPTVLRLGAQTDAALPAPWQIVQSETQVNQVLKQSTGAATRRITPSKATRIDAVKVRLFWDRCLRTNDDVANPPANTGHQIFIKEGNGSFQLRWQNTEYIYSSSSFEQEIYFTLNQAEYYEIKVARITGDDNDKTFSTASWKSYTTVTNAKLRYPNTAKIGLQVDLKAFGASDLQRVYQIDGAEILIPDNASVRADGSLEYIGIWTGGFKREWTTDPAWCLFDLLANDRYGCRINPTKMDKFAFQAASAYCSALIPDGFGGTEPRFSLNAEIKDRETAYALVQKLCGVFNAIAYYETNTLIPVIDRPLSITHQFTNANATFTYAGTPYRNRRNRAVVSYTLADIPNNIDYEIYEDRADILIRGVEETRIDGFGCSSRGQAARIAKWAIYSEQSQTETCVIQTGMDGAQVQPGQIIQIGDRDRAGIRRWGRIKTATDRTIILDNPLNVIAGNFDITCALPDGTLTTKQIASISDSTVTIVGSFSTIPEADATWLIAGTDLQPALYRVISRSEVETYRFEILALLHEPTKYASIEQGLNFAQPARAITIPSPPIPPQNLTLTPDTVGSITLAVSWLAPTPSTYTTGYQIEWREFDEIPVALQTTALSYLLTGIYYGEFEFRIRSIDTTGDYSGWVVESILLSPLARFIESYLNPEPTIEIKTNFETYYTGDIVFTRMISTVIPTPIDILVAIFESITDTTISNDLALGSAIHYIILN